MGRCFAPLPHSEPPPPLTAWISASWRAVNARHDRFPGAQGELSPTPSSFGNNGVSTFQDNEDTSFRVPLHFTVAKRHSVVEGTGLRYMTLRCSRTSLAGHGGWCTGYLCCAGGKKSRGQRRSPARFFVAVATQITRNHYVCNPHNIMID